MVEHCRAGWPVEITPLEFKLLAEVWGRGVFVTDGVIDPHVTNLRKMIEPEPALPRDVVSVRGDGYRFDG